MRLFAAAALLCCLALALSVASVALHLSSDRGGPPADPTTAPTTEAPPVAASPRWSSRQATLASLPAADEAGERKAPGPAEVASSAAERHIAPPPPKAGGMTLTVDAMGVASAPIITAPVSGEGRALAAGVLHPAVSDNPWEANSDVYLAAHRIGYRNTPSWRLFSEIDALAEGDKAVVTDSAGRRYVYRVVSAEDDVSATATGHIDAPGNGQTLTLQSCTLPDLTRRYLVRARLVEVIDP